MITELRDCNSELVAKTNELTGQMFQANKQKEAMEEELRQTKEQLQTLRLE